ncbi:DUF2642 domain-containing protein [Paenibacillus piri]|uniref:DUF2642 domain-containing protein n=1 Tax=Paenibacillus piri TaxID=2547395 RepID=A0A4R5KKT7_9BACL|nr:DUF2642 domain-containing protein [Paenibacillus piri]TDF95030.1 DUF2642 domain-containing protein [Paenibacillus piri]
MSALRQFINKDVEVEISGKQFIKGKVIDVGSDLIVLFHEQRFYYIPIVHIQNVKLSYYLHEDPDMVPVEPIDYQTDSLSFRKILQNAKGSFVEINMTGNKAIHGYLTSIMNDYFVFYSPVYKAMFISMNHLKWLIPYRPGLAPYSLSNYSLQPINFPLSRTFEDQCKKMEGQLVVFDLGDNSNKIGLLQKADYPIIELVNANGDIICWNVQHLKTVHRP